MEKILHVCNSPHTVISRKNLIDFEEIDVRMGDTIKYDSLLRKEGIVAPRLIAKGYATGSER